MNLDFHKLLLNALKAVCFSVFVVKFYQKMIHHTFRYTTQKSRISKLKIKNP